MVNAENIHIMVKLRLLVAVFVGTLFYTLISVAGGRDGLWATSQMQEQKQTLSAHTAKIEKTNGELSLEKIALEKDLDVIASYAKNLAMFRKAKSWLNSAVLPPVKFIFLIRELLNAITKFPISLNGSVNSFRSLLLFWFILCFSF